MLGDSVKLDSSEDHYRTKVKIHDLVATNPLLNPLPSGEGREGVKLSHIMQLSMRMSIIKIAIPIRIAPLLRFPPLQ
jgi:hypothetical protein